jgi:hypothetical protein
MNTGGKFNKWRLLIFANYNKCRNDRKSFIGIFTVVKRRQSGIGIQASGSVRYQWDPELDHK